MTSAAAAWAGFAGSWLLVAGPICQAAIELEAEDIERDIIRDAAENIEAPPSCTRWWSRVLQQIGRLSGSGPAPQVSPQPDSREPS